MNKIKYFLMSFVFSLTLIGAVGTANAYYYNNCHAGYWRHGYWHPQTCNNVQCRWVHGYRDRYGYYHYPHKVCNLL